MRLKIIRVVIIICFVMIALDLGYVQVFRGRYFYNLSTNNRIRIVPLEGFRGRILDRNGKLLADRRVAYNVMVAPQDIENHEELFRFLAKVLNTAPEKLESVYRQKKYAPFAPVVVAEDIGRDKAIIFEENKFLFPGLIVEEGFKRSYPMGRNSAHVLGYVGKVTPDRLDRAKEYGYSPQGITGYSGVEEYYDSYLKGGEGGLQIEVNSRSQQVRLLSLKEPTGGQDITLTIDSDIQQIAMEALGGQTGSIVILSLKDGEVLGMVNEPSYDPNVFVDASKRDQIPRLFTASSAPLLNRAIKGQFPPGSLFKIPMAIAGLESGKITPRTSYLCKGVYDLGGRSFRCTHTHGSQNLIQSIAHSCNIYYYHLGLLVGPESIRKYAHLFGLGRLTRIDLPYEARGGVPSPRRHGLGKKSSWYAGDTLNFSIGQGGVLATPLQLAKMMAIVGNDGMDFQPHVIKRIGAMEVAQYNFKRPVSISPGVLDVVKKGMRATVTDYSGTAHIVDLEGVYVAGKTGTAQTSGEQEHHAWFAGYAHGSNRDIAFCVFLEHGGSSLNACAVARQLFIKMMEKSLL